MKSYEIHAPWTEEQVIALNKYQNNNKTHPFTGKRHENGDECVLVATPQGWITCCGNGVVIQTWAWDFMTKKSS